MLKVRHNTLFRTKSNQSAPFADKRFLQNFRNRICLDNIWNINAWFLHKQTTYMDGYARNYASFASNLQMQRKRSIDATQTIYRCNANDLYQEHRRSIYGWQMMCFQYTDHLFFFFQSCPYLCILLSISKMLVFVRFFSSFPASGRNYRILVMHKKQSVITARLNV